MEKRSDHLSTFQENKDEQIVNESNSNYRSLHIPSYSDGEAVALAERLVNKETCREARQVLTTWLEEGQCNEKNSDNFYSLIQVCWNEVEKLKTEQKACLEESVKVQKNSVKKNFCLHFQLEEIEKLFKALYKENVWSNFTWTQIENIREMKKDILDFKQNLWEDCFNVVEEQEFSDMSDVNSEDMGTENSTLVLNCKAGSLTNGSNTSDQKSEDPKSRCSECEKEIFNSKAELENIRKVRDKINITSGGGENVDTFSQYNLNQVHENELHFISLISVFLYCNPDGANIDSISSHLNECSKSNKCIPTTSVTQIENLLRRYPAIFQKSSPHGATQETNWTCITVSPNSVIMPSK